MKNTARITALTLVVTLTILSGYMQGTLRRRWGASKVEETAAARLVQFPMTMGPWQTIQEGELDETAVRMLQPSGQLVRVLREGGGAVPVSMTLLVGPPGYIGAHTPEVCVSGIGYQKIGATERVTVSPPDHPELKGTFWVATFRSRAYDRHILREYWAWSTGGPWEAATGSRMGYGFYPYLYKVQLGCRLPAGSDPATADPTLGLLQQIVLESPAYLVNADAK